MSRKSIETQRVKAILDYLALYPRKVFAWRQNTGAVTIGNRHVRFGIAGAADITGILADGRRLEIEVKAPKGRQSVTQKAFQEVIERMGGLYVLARSADDVIEELGDVLA